MRGISRKLCVGLFTLCKISTAILRILWRHLQTDLRTVYSVTKYISSRNRCRKQCPNRCIIGDAILPQTGTKLTKKRGSKYGGLVTLSDAVEKNRNIGAQPQSIVHTTVQKKILENLLPVGRLVRTILFIPSRFWTTYTNFDNFCLRYIATSGNFFLYRCTSTFSTLNYCGRIFFKSLSYLYEVVRTNFSADFWTFRNF